MKTIKLLAIPMYIGWLVVVGMLVFPIITGNTESIVFLLTRTHFPWGLVIVVVYTIMLLIVQSYYKQPKTTIPQE